MIEVEGRIERLDDLPLEVAQRVRVLDEERDDAQVLGHPLAELLAEHRPPEGDVEHRAEGAAQRRCATPTAKVLTLESASAACSRLAIRRATRGAGLSDIDETWRDGVTQALPTGLGTLFIDEPAVEATTVELQPFQCGQLAGV